MLKYLGISFDVTRKLKVPVALQRIKLFRTFNYIYSCDGASASPIVLCHLLTVFCLPVLLYGLEAVPISNTTLRTLQSIWNVALYIILS